MTGLLAGLANRPSSNTSLADTVVDFYTSKSDDGNEDQMLEQSLLFQLANLLGKTAIFFIIIIHIPLNFFSISSFCNFYGAHLYFYTVSLMQSLELASEVLHEFFADNLGGVDANSRALITRTKILKRVHSSLEKNLKSRKGNLTTKNMRSGMKKFVSGVSVETAFLLPPFF